MLRHQGESRTLAHNLKLASMLSFVAGIVNITGFLAIERLTTNVTGHFAFSIDEALKSNILQSAIFLLYVLSFLIGSFFSNFLVEIVSRKQHRLTYFFPLLVEAAILGGLPLLGQATISCYANWVACLMLFAMGIQNSMVTSISSAVVRTTHLTGLFTDLGIEFSQLMFYHNNADRMKLFSTIKLRLTIVLFFFVGGIIGGLAFGKFNVSVLYLASFVLICGLTYEILNVNSEVSN